MSCRHRVHNITRIMIHKNSTTRGPPNIRLSMHINILWTDGVRFVWIYGIILLPNHRIGSALITRIFTRARNTRDRNTAREMWKTKKKTLRSRIIVIFSEPYIYIYKHTRIYGLLQSWILTFCLSTCDMQRYIYKNTIFFLSLSDRPLVVLLSRLACPVKLRDVYQQPWPCVYIIPELRIYIYIFIYDTVII